MRHRRPLPARAQGSGAEQARDALASALRAEGRRLRASAGASSAARARNAWERWIEETLADTRAWTRAARTGAQWDDEAGLTESTAHWVQATLEGSARDALAGAGPTMEEAGEDAIRSASEALDAFARALCAQAYEARSVEHGGERLEAMGQGDEAQGRGRAWPMDVSIAALEALGQASPQAFEKLGAEPPWLRRAALEAAGRGRDPKWLDADPEGWLRRGAQIQAKQLGVEGPRPHECMRTALEGWRGWHNAPPLALALVARRASGRALGDAQWAAAQEIATEGAITAPGEAREIALAQRLAQRARAVHTEVAKRVRRGALELYTAEALRVLAHRWADAPALEDARAPRPARLEEHEDAEVAWTVEYDSAERIACAAWARAMRPSEVLDGHWALRLRVGGFKIVALLENAPRADTPRAREPGLARKVATLKKIEAGVKTRWDR